MTIYWLLFAASVPGIFVDPQLKSFFSKLSWRALVVICIFVVGLRYRVGCDWQNYADLYEAIRTNSDFGLSRLTAIFSWGPAFLGLNWLSAQLGLGVYFVNLVCAGISIGGLATFCRRLSIPWLGWTIATPYFIVVVTMGYTRQSVAIGLFLGALNLLQDRKVLRYIGVILVATMFHASALVLLPLALTPWFREQPRKYISIFVLVIIFLGLILGPDAYRQIQGYIDTNRVSYGAIVRSLMTIIPALFLFTFRRSLAQLSKAMEVWYLLSLASVLLFFSVWLISTPTDRISLYLIPIQIFVWASLPIIPSFNRFQTLVKSSLVLYSASILWVWTSFGLNSRCWMPYQNLFFKSGIF